MYMSEFDSRRCRYGGGVMNRRFLAYLPVILVLASVCGAEFQVNTRTSNDQKNAAIAMDRGGNFIVVWSSYLQDGSSNGIFGQQFDPNYRPVGGEFQVNTTSSGNQAEPAAAMDAAAGFVVVWHGPGLTAEDKEDIFAQRFDSNGLPLSDELPVNNYTGDKQFYPSVALNNDGTFVVVWESVNFPEDGDKAIFGQLYDSNGVRIGDEFVVNAEPSVCRYPDVAADANGNFAVVWLEDKSRNSIMAGLFDPNGAPLTDTFKVNTISFSSVTRPSIAMESAGYFAVAWDGDPKLAGLDDIHARLFDPNGAPLSEQFFVNSTFEGPQRYPKVAMNDRQEFVIVWETRTDPNVNERDIFGQRFNNFGTTLGDEFLVNTYTEGDQRNAVAVLGEDGHFITAWQSYAQDGSRNGIFAETGRLVGSADYNGDGYVDFLDYSILADQWLEEGPAVPADLIYNNRIDEQDLAEFARQWLMLSDE